MNILLKYKFINTEEEFRTILKREIINYITNPKKEYVEFMFTWRIIWLIIKILERKIWDKKNLKNTLLITSKQNLKFNLETQEEKTKFTLTYFYFEKTQKFKNVLWFISYWISVNFLLGFSYLIFKSDFYFISSKIVDYIFLLAQFHIYFGLALLFYVIFIQSFLVIIFSDISYTLFNQKGFEIINSINSDEKDSKANNKKVDKAFNYLKKHNIDL
ncbi:hypothetical protein ACW95P_00840 [Candidatus Mycoplasma pogonae]